MDLGLTGKIALVTGASAGLGEAIACRLAREGAHVILVARREERLRQVEARILEAGGSAECLSADLGQEETWGSLAAQVRSAHGHLHLLVNNAGRELFSPLQATAVKALKETVQVNFVAVAGVTRSLLGLLKDGSAIVNVSSTSAIQGAAGMSVYAGTKGAILAFTQSLARELAGRGVRVNAVAPGQVRTEMLDRILAKLGPDQAASLEAAHPLGFGDPGDVAAAVAFLGSAQARWITGQVLVVDGGMTA
jgi:3-oxoacyl-[acyl-carrier protein] reductase